MPEVGPDGLTNLQRGFFAGLRQGMSGLESARFAGYKGNDATLMVRASKLRGNARLVAASAAGSGDVEQEELAPPAPQVGPQTTMADCVADIAFFGGSAGGGKSWSLLFEFIKWAVLIAGRWCLPNGLRAVIFRRTAPELVGGGGLWDESNKMFRELGGRARRSPGLDWIFPGYEEREDGELVMVGTARLELRHLLRDDDRYAHSGRQYFLVGFDESTHFSKVQFWYLYGRLRSMTGRPYLRATCNPLPDTFVAELVAWWIAADGYPILSRSGVLRWLVRVGDEIRWHSSREAAIAEHGPDCEPASLTFIASRLADNKILTDADPAYRAKLKALSRVDRLRLLGDPTRGGNWKVRPSAGLCFRREDFRVVNSAPEKIVATVRCWDKGATAIHDKNPDPDWTRGVRVNLLEGGGLYIDDLVSLRDRPAVVLEAQRETAVDDGTHVTIGIWQDTGGAGVFDAEMTAAYLNEFNVEIVGSAEGVIRGHGGKGVAKWVHAKAWSPLVERHEVYVKQADWTNTLIDECDGFPEAAHDDIVDGISLAWQLLAGDARTTMEEAMAKIGKIYGRRRRSTH